MADSLSARDGTCRAADARASADWKPGAGASKWLGTRHRERDNGCRVRHSHRGRRWV